MLDMAQPKGAVARERVNGSNEEKIMEWQPIETAPKDGRLILVYNNLNNGTITSINGKIAVARYGHQHDGLEESLWEYGTYYSENSKDNQGAYLISATHWMPLPNPPPLI